MPHTPGHKIRRKGLLGETPDEEMFRRNEEFYKKHPTDTLELSPTEHTTQYGRTVYKDQFGKIHSESTVTVPVPNGGWMNIPSIYSGQYVTDDRARDIILNNGMVDPETGVEVKVYASDDEAVEAARERMRTLNKKDQPWNKRQVPSGLLREGIWDKVPDMRARKFEASDLKPIPRAKPFDMSNVIPLAEAQELSYRGSTYNPVLGGASPPNYGALGIMPPETVSLFNPADVPKLPRGVSNKNPLNIRKANIAWDGKVRGEDKDFETFNSDLMGIRAGAKNSLTHFRRGLNTVNKLLSTHAPPSENPTNSFVAFVSGRMGVGPDDIINLEDQFTLMSYIIAVIAFENENYSYDMGLVRKAVEMALGRQ